MQLKGLQMSAEELWACMRDHYQLLIATILEMDLSEQHILKRSCLFKTGPNKAPAPASLLWCSPAAENSPPKCLHVQQVGTFATESCESWRIAPHRACSSPCLLHFSPHCGTLTERCLSSGAAVARGAL